MTIFNMLDGRYADKTIKGYYDNLPIFPPLIHVALGEEHIADQVVAELDRRFPGLASQVEMRDVATPVTFLLPGLYNFYMTG